MKIQEAIRVFADNFVFEVDHNNDKHVDVWYDLALCKDGEEFITAGKNHREMMKFDVLMDCYDFLNLSQYLDLDECTDNEELKEEVYNTMMSWIDSIIEINEDEGEF